MGRGCEMLYSGNTIPVSTGYGTDSQSHAQSSDIVDRYQQHPSYQHQYQQQQLWATTATTTTSLAFVFLILLWETTGNRHDEGRQ